MGSLVNYVVSNLASPRGKGNGMFIGLFDKILANNGVTRDNSGTNEGLDKAAIKKAEDDERRRKRNLRGRELIGIANLNNGLGGIKNILGG